jgi:hypothetical protein
VIAVESPTATFQLDDFSIANIVSAAILVTELLVFYYLHMRDDEGMKYLQRKCIIL